jgi:hypothetical protein
MVLVLTSTKKIMKPSVMAVDLPISKVEGFKKHCMSNPKGKRKDGILWKNEKESRNFLNECESVSKRTKMRIVTTVNLRKITGMVKTDRLKKLNTGQ